MNATKKCNKCEADKYVSEFYAEKRSRDGFRSVCKSCFSAAEKTRNLANPEKSRRLAREKSQRYRENHPDLVKQHEAAYRDENRDKRRASSLQWAADNPERHLANAKRYYEANREAALKKTRRYTDEGRYLDQKSAYRKENREELRATARDAYKADPAKNTEKVRRRVAAKKQAFPEWANLFFIQEAYRLARLRSDMTGFKWHVDHIVPLHSQIVCGMHVEHNLQVIPGVSNCAKGNRHWPDMPTN